MFYSMDRILAILPCLGLVLLGVTLAALELRESRATLTDRSADGDGPFIPPNGDGYEYYVSRSVLVYILRRGAALYRVYLLQGSPPRVRLRQDRYGRYFSVRCRDAGTAERIVDAAFREG